MNEPFIHSSNTLAWQVPLLCATDNADAPNSSQFLFSYDTYAECVFRGFLQTALVVGAVGGLVLLLVVQQLANYFGARRAATASRDAHRCFVFS